MSVPWTPSGSVPRYPGGGDGRRKGLFRTNSVKEVQCLQNGETSNVNERRMGLPWGAAGAMDVCAYLHMW